MTRRELKYLNLLAVSALVLSFITCGDETMVQPEGPEPPPPPGTVGASGATLVFAGGNVTLTFPPGAVSQRVTINVDAATASPSHPGLVGGTVYHFQPDGIQFAQAVLLSIKYDPTKVAAGVEEPSLRLYEAVDGTWDEIVESSVDITERTVSASINNFSNYGIVGLKLATCSLDGSLLSWPVCPGDVRQDPFQDYAQFNGGSPYTYHTGLDINAPPGDLVFAAGAGLVRRLRMEDHSTGDNHCMGNVVIIDHGVGDITGPFTLYAHLQTPILIPHGKYVKRGTLIGTVGNTGAGKRKCPLTYPYHLHFEVKDRNVLGSIDDDGKYWGYTGVPAEGQAPHNHPDEHGYHDPMLFFHSTETIPPTVVQMTRAGQGARLRLGPGDYRVLRSVTSGEAFISSRASLPTTDPYCTSGWFQVRHTKEERYFLDPSISGSSIPDAWICRGDGTEVWVAPARIFAASGTGTSYPPSDLYVVSVSAGGADSLVGRIRTSSGSEPVITDVARSPDGSLWGISFTRLYRLDTLTAIATEVGSSSLGLQSANALGFDSDANLYGATGFIGRLLRIDTVTGRATVVGSFGSGFTSWGDIAFAPDGTLFATVKVTGEAGTLVTVDPTNGEARYVSQGTAIGFGNVWGLAFVGPTLYGLTTDVESGKGQLIVIDTNEGTGTLVRELDFNAFGAGLAGGRSPVQVERD